VQYGGHYTYAVTAKHAVAGRNGPPWLSANTRGAGRVQLESFADHGQRHWYFHPTDSTADVAVAPLVSPPEMDILAVPCRMFLCPQKLRDYQIGIGDEVFFPGLFEHAHGSKQNTPILRHGNIAMLPPSDQIQVDLRNGRSEFMDVYLIESRSIGGLSGSPVFARETAFTRGKNKKGRDVELQGVSDFQLLGLISGHWDTISHPVSVNAGIAIVVPAHKILETLDHPDLLKMRIENETRLFGRVSPTSR
jgi:hypothetical protein